LIKTRGSFQLVTSMLPVTSDTSIEDPVVETVSRKLNVFGAGVL